MDDGTVSGTRRKYHLLVVEDDAVDQAQYARLLSRKAPGIFQIEQSFDGMTGLAALATENFDCVLLDLNLPDMTGFEFLTDAVADKDLSCAVVLVTGQGNEAIAVEAMKRGVQDYLVKDQVNEDSLFRAITRAVTQKELRRRLAATTRDLSRLNTALSREVAVREATEVALREAKDIAEQANRAKTRFVAMVTHELRTPLAGILGYAELLRIEAGLSSRQDAHVGAMMQAGEHLRVMIEQMLDFAGMETGRITLRPQRLAVAELAHCCAGLVRPLAERRGLGLEVSRSDTAPSEIVADPQRLRQVLLNLLGNAVKYTSEGGVALRLLKGASPGGLRVEVADTGPGIDACRRHALFEDFERLDADPGVEGAGLGLAISSRLARMMQGSIGYAAGAVCGSLFWLELPAECELGAATPALRAAQATLPAAPRRVLLVDDIAMNRDVIAAFLRAGGHSVLLASGGAEAVGLAAADRFDVILMDLRMADMDGLEATRRIRLLPAPHGEVTILALTAQPVTGRETELAIAGLDGLLAKPVDYATLMRAVAQVPLLACQHEAPDAASSLPLFDSAVLDQTMAFLSAGEAAVNLALLRERKQELVRLIDAQPQPALLAETAHGLAAAAGMFGFIALSSVCRRFEQAVAANLPDATLLAGLMRTETENALHKLDQVLRAGGIGAT